MSKKKKKPLTLKTPEPASNSFQPSISSRGWKTVGAGIAFVVIGFILLTFTDPFGQNWASSISPLFIIAGYSIIALGILQKDHSPQN